jgi:hypothetical protein
MGGVPYGVNGYRSDCRSTPFNGVVTFDHSTNQNAWFLQQSGTTFTLAASTSNSYFIHRYDRNSPFGIPGTFQLYGLWTGYGAAGGQSYSYQFGACASTITADVGGLGVGLFLSGLKSD